MIIITEGKMTYKNTYMNRIAGLVVLLILQSSFFSLYTYAQRITAKGPGTVAAGQPFQIQYVVNTTDVKGFRIGNVPDALDVVYGPSTSTQQSFSMVNGRTTQSSSVTYTYTLIAKKNGTFVIPSAHATVSGSPVSSQALKINVSGHMHSGQQGRMQSSQQPAQRVDRAGSRISGNDLFIRVTANKQRVYEQEPILLTYKVYTLVDLTQLEGKMPDLNGFHTQEIPLPQQKSFHVETINGRAYRCVTWSQYVMFPQMSGKLEIPSITFRGTVVQENPNVDPFEAFFNGGSGYVEVKKEIKAPSVTIQVDPLPTKPAGYSGGVGHFNVTSSVDKTTVKSGDPVSLRVVVSGVGNMKLLKMPELNLPKDFDKYDPKVTDKTKLSADGVTGSMVYDYLIVPRNKGRYTIPGIDFIYFDTQSKTYKTAKTQPINLTVEQGSGNGNVADYSQLDDNDISDIMQGVGTKEKPYYTFFGTTAHVIANVVALLAFVILLIVFRKRASALADVTAVRGRRANKVAVKRLKKAAKLMTTGKRSEFYEEVLRALWGYVGDKLNMPVEQLSRDNISEKLANRNIDDDTIKRFIEAIDECEFARYAPSGEQSEADMMMKNTYNKATEAITEIEEGGKSKTNSKKPDTNGTVTATNNAFTTIVLLLVQMLFASTQAFAANTKADADAAYRVADYQKAIELYKEDLKSGESAETYHNLGNCYFRTDNIPQAILSYERAHKLAPGNKRINHSLEIARTKTIDRLTPDSDIFFVQWYKALQAMMTIDAWAWLALCSLIVSLILFLVYLFVGNMLVRKASFYVSVTLFLLFIIGNLFAWQRKRYLTTHTSAVVMTETLTVKSSPEIKAQEACIIHEGTTVEITDRDIKGWYGIRLSDGREGWINTKDVEEI